MPFSHVVYNRYSDNLAVTAASCTLGAGTAETGYSVDWVRDVNAARPLRLSTKQASIVFGMGSAKSVAIVAIFHPNFQEGLSILVQGNNSNSWGSPTFSTSMAQPAWRAGRFPGQPWKDLRHVANWGAFNYWRIAIASDNAVNLSIGDIWLGSTIRTFNVQWNDKFVTQRPQVERSTAYRRLRIPYGTIRRSMSGTIPASDAARADIVDWILDADGRPVLFIPESRLVSGSEVPMSGDPAEAWLALHAATTQDVNEQFSNAHFLPFDMEEDGRGLEPTPSPLA